MGTSQLFAGNLANLIIAILAFLQIISWPIAGYLIVGSVLLSILGWSSSRSHAPPASESRNSDQPIRSTRLANSRQLRSTEIPVETKAEPDQARPSGHISKASAEINLPENEAEPKPSDGPTRIGEGDYLSFDLQMRKGEEVVGEVSSTGEVNLYIMNDENVTALDSDQQFWYEQGLEGIRGGSLRFVAPEDGEWFLIVENADTKEVEAKTKITMTTPSHPVSLKTDALELPDARLEGKL